MSVVTPEQTVERQPLRLANGWLPFVAVGAAATLAGGPGLRDAITLSRTDDSASHIVLVPAVTAVLIWMNRDAIFARVTTCRAGLGLAGAGVAMAMAAALGVFPGDAMHWAVAGTLTGWIGAFLFAFGAAAFRAALFPLLFLVCAVPIPGPLLAEAVRVLKTGSADAVGLLFSVTATPHIRSEFMFELPGFVIEIADECSGIRSSIALALTSTLAGYVFLDSPWRRVVLVMLVLPVAIAKNAIRIVTLSLLAIHVDPSFLVGQLHHDGGILFFLFALAMLVPALSALRASESRRRLLPGVFHPSTR